MKKLITLILGITLVYSCSKSSDGTTNANLPVTDIDGNIYQTVTISNQIWTKTNLNVSKYKNGDVIPQVTDATEWAALTTGAWCYNANTSSNGTTYGKLYNWYAINDPRGLAPLGYHIPTQTEWEALISYLGVMPSRALREAGSLHWEAPNTDATNSSGFTALPGGYRYYGGIFYSNSAGWWSSSEYSLNSAFKFSLDLSDWPVIQQYPEGCGFSVRCLKN